MVNSQSPVDLEKIKQAKQERWYQQQEATYGRMSDRAEERRTEERQLYAQEMERRAEKMTQRRAALRDTLFLLRLLFLLGLIGGGGMVAIHFLTVYR